MRKADFVIIAAAIAFFGFSVFSSENGKNAAIYVNGRLYETLSLDKDTSVTVKSRYGTNTVTVSGGKVKIIDSDCPNRLCEKNSVSRTGESLVCLPNRLSVVIEGGKDNQETDVVV